MPSGGGGAERKMILAPKVAQVWLLGMERFVLGCGKRVVVG